MNTSNGNRWRTELKKALLPYLKKKTDCVIIDNLSRRFVPHYSPPRINEKEIREKQTKDHKIPSWDISPSFQLDDQHAQEIVDIGKQFSEIGHLSHEIMKQIFIDNKWETERSIPVIDLYDKRGNWRYDAYKDRIAIEVELSGRSQIFKDAFKFLIGEALGLIDVGIIMIRQNKEKNGPYFELVDKYSHPIYETLPMINMAFYGFPFGNDKSRPVSSKSNQKLQNLKTKYKW
jgi:hypothetical protein